MYARLFWVVVVAASLSLHADDEVTRELAKRDDVPAEYLKSGTTFRLKLMNVLPHASYVDDTGVVLAAPEPANVDPIAPTKTPCEAGFEPAAYVRFKLKGLKAEEGIADAVKAATQGLAKDCADKITAAVNTLTTATTKTSWVLGDEPKRLQVVRADDKTRTWLLVVAPKQTPAEIADAEKNREGTKRINDLLDRTMDSADIVVRQCAYPEDCPAEPIFINGDQISTVYITNLPTKRLKVRVFAGESSSCSALDANYREFTETHETIVIPLHMRTRLLPWFFGAGREEYGLRVYGLVAPSEYVATVQSQKNGQTVNDISLRFRPKDIDEATRASLCSQMPEQVFSRLSSPSDFASRLRIGSTDIPAVPLLLRGKSNLLTIEVRDAATSQHLKTFLVPIRYQRFWLDAGGFFAFARHVDEDVVKTSLTGTQQGSVKVTQIRQIKDVNPSTGIVVNIHPGNFPYMAAQFGIAAQQDRLPSYYLGFGLRAREFGKRSLATLAIGIAAVQSNRLNGLRLNGTAADCGTEERCVILPADSPLLTPQRKYAFEPYVSISLGFSFGGAPDRADVGRSVSRQ